MNTNFSLHVSSSADTTHERGSTTVVSPSSAPVNRNLDIAKLCVDINQTLKHFNPDLLKISDYMTEEEMAQVLDLYQQSLQVV
jgi:hypothetical protein